MTNLQNQAAYEGHLKSCLLLQMFYTSLAENWSLDGL